ncbi:MAG: putative metal-binding motif-containing protein [Archangium sp.]
MTRAVIALAVCSLFAACPKPCETSDQCTDGAYCNGEEVCVDRKCQPGPPPVCDDGIACTVDSCSEERRRCIAEAPDVDGDSYGDATCVDRRGEPLGMDCDDNDESRFPGNLETCNAVDEDCDLETIGTTDVDGDGYVSAACSNPLLDGGVRRGLDCNDTVEAIHPGQAELCNQADDNCNGVADEGVTTLRFTDSDGDGWGSGQGAQGCVVAGTSALGTDCDDANPAIHPGEFQCVSGGQGNEVRLCSMDGGWTPMLCPTQGQCRRQPNETGICL